MIGTLLIFTKNRILGTAKTRIGKEKGDAIALKVYEKLLRHTQKITSNLDAHKIVYFNKFIEDSGEIWPLERYQFALQVEGDLGNKMSAAFEENFRKVEQPAKVLIIGSDCAQLSQSSLEIAFQALEEKEVVIGPAKDGGYYLLGMKAFEPDLFQDMPWSSQDLLAETLKFLNTKGITYALLEEMSDVDYWEDWEALGWELD